ncbi:MAG: RnfABCDGE type electron transport complex subunit B, partial [Rudaea sp.]|nr:RnfABCDGE type electron transport complex subunit B [Rudaea sp.]
MSTALPDPPSLVQRIDALLPQTQCTRCGYPACLAYAEAIAAGEADLNQCPPGGAEGIRELATLLGRETKPLNPANGVEQPAEIAVIDEDACIGCTKCIQVCPVDAIVGANKLMHTVLSAECSGCELCIPACPVDCIAMIVDETQNSLAHNAHAAH